MIFATILTICTTVNAPCSEYIIDTATNAPEAAINKAIQASDMHIAWANDATLQAHLAKFNIVEPLALIQTYEVSNEIIPEDELP
ncbi:hypothetical protein vB_PsyM_KIL3b_0163 [Pseudomonas phage vB_PsyM_KIL3b]|uniref:Uncharacterized protein n=6 Tax=Flaumdravirus TaxID=2560133 RepID=A0A142IEB3_9CAUD|nr:hypothetical protein BH774_gp041 [Pseudomonas phage vB_PsyM_KIL1]YP_009616849.1 hypothetical protein FDI83_gp041 [Pseudomonas phage vB_PsyM_KIL4]AMR57568.1 hypothetical protein vB_PsyM_KIL2_0168 [Pseudomonas phage vB_PsyM_KIL2]AMR57730.1 hypothetical protein vB_PsyM_KIL3_0163 [Pseudomonas phage vB_PsyM_KIL3]AMR58065.1 hypothetical protein vB_PsyM_KIL5_0174 [Pseudomonas phage vB_PsyM_KIL5]AMR58228.1 hypothetical protein vB_PsyM_KIL3b_0163 [Pseudomonas phage vB_PsyM_KIL3b]AMR57408.1 hypothet